TRGPAGTTPPHCARPRPAPARTPARPGARRPPGGCAIPAPAGPGLSSWVCSRESDPLLRPRVTIPQRCGSALPSNGFPVILGDMHQTSARKCFWVRLGIVLGIWMVLAFVLTGQATLVVYSAARAQADLPRDPGAYGVVELFWNTLAECLTWVPL